MLQKTNYAIQINDPWGVGKTYYVTQVLKQRIENIDVFKENPKEGKYKFIYVSLNGLRNVDEIGESVFLGSINKYGSGTYKLTKIGLGIGAKVPGWKFLEKADEGMNTITKFSKHLKKCILCFDDLERIDKSVSIQQVLGYINSTYIEHENIKTLFISNEEKMNENKDFYKIKEKVIGRTIQYDKKLNEVLPDFMQNNYGDNENVHQFYTENSDTILQIISYVNEKINLRTLGFVFDSFTQVMSKCKTLIKHNNEMYLSVFTNILLISNDYKEGELNRIEELEPLYDLIQLSFFIEFDNKKESSDLDYGSRFWYRYFKKQTIIRGFVHVYKSISEYILTGHLNVALLESEIKAKYSQEEEKLEDKALRIVENYIDYELDQINNSLQTLIEGIEKGYYTPDRYPRLYRK
ncbi:P-loop NTPase fold protein [Bacillus arachidis]|uniref:KAP family P-loop domain-containing protein n=1 Tax=Bacillus arachidis TaxID=2819290 RepID=A0ABS3NTH4_9BACI|nr:P-loop NTPase fold protein [Bacillus arachidis]MBO1624216.1 hypothetical protein [Bacillus arachidis]